MESSRAEGIVPPDKRAYALGMDLTLRQPSDVSCGRTSPSPMLYCDMKTECPICPTVHGSQPCPAPVIRQPANKGRASPLRNIAPRETLQARRVLESDQGQNQSGRVDSKVTCHATSFNVNVNVNPGPQPPEKDLAPPLHSPHAPARARAHARRRPFIALASTQGCSASETCILFAGGRAGVH